VKTQAHYCNQKIIGVEVAATAAFDYEEKTDAIYDKVNVVK
jgi:hypothetical protein